MRLERMAYVVDGFPKVTHTFVAGEIAEVIRRGVDVGILSLRSGDDGVVHGIVHDNDLLGRTVYDTDRFEATLEDLRPQIVHAHFARRATARARELAGSLGVPFTYTAHNYDVSRRPPDDMAERAAASSGVVTVSRWNADFLAERLGVDRAKIHVIPCGIDVERFTPGGAGEAPPLVVAVARLHPIKNLPLLLDACARVAAGGTRLCVAVIGDGDERADLERRRAELGLDEVVRFVGHLTQETVADWWRRADVGALTSDSEGMPVALMEAAACGVPVVATAVGGVPDMVVEDVTGRVVPPGDAAVFAAALEQLLSDPPLRRRMGAAARRHAVDRFSVAHQVDRLMEVWTRAIAPTAAVGR